ncbi:serine/threonine-protein kinase [Streptomyces sp. SID4956]|uniref:Serine/threonine-protein kinase n=1 Tax=Streptomyces thermocarboxydus TaxID=59299 RepID=A0ABU3JB65_9ACTN|nr:serine/threonine-protein kinase [Streptomyces thermocarboxydus]MYQ30276.1 PQQ-binding-like beta-propeller repeat protein [Streptomyces sp. SID4956]
MAPQQDAGAGAEAERPEFAGHYRLERPLGSGGMGVVHLARSTSGLKLAVKVVHAEYAKDPEFRGRFRQEVAAARRVSGAFTASVVDADPEAELPWMATLYIPGPTLADEVKRNGPLGSSQLRRLMAGLAEALRDIHRVGVVHRDLKPSNVLLSEDGPKVIDFGISRPKDSELRTETGKLIGTPPFMAPEQFRRPREVGPAADIFALGSVLVHAATGRGPFDSDSPYVVAYQVVHDEPDLTGVPDELSDLVRRCLAKEPEERPTPDELMAGLRAVAASYDTRVFIPSQRIDDEPDIGSRPRPERAPEKPAPEEEAPRRRFALRRMLVSGAALAAVVAGTVVAVRLGDTAPPERPVTHSAAAFAGWASEPLSDTGGMPQCAVASGAVLCAHDGTVSALRASDGKVLWRHATGAEADAPVISGGTVLSYGGGTELEALDAVSGRTVWARTVPEGVDVRSTGALVILGDGDGTVTAVNGATGETVWERTVPPESEITDVTVFGASAPVVLTSSAPDGGHTQVTALDPRDGEVRWQDRMEGALTPVATDGDAVHFVSADPLSPRTDALVRHAPGSGTTTRYALPVPRYDTVATGRGKVVHVMAQGGSLEAFDLETRDRLWTLETGLTRASAPVSDGRHVFLSAPDGRLLAVDAGSGRLVGQTRPRLGAGDRVVASLPAPVLAGDRVYASAPDGTVFAVDASDPAAW